MLKTTNCQTSHQWHEGPEQPLQLPECIVFQVVSKRRYVHLGWEGHINWIWQSSFSIMTNPQLHKNSLPAISFKDSEIIDIFHVCFLRLLSISSSLSIYMGAPHAWDYFIFHSMCCLQTAAFTFMVNFLTPSP